MRNIFTDLPEGSDAERIEAVLERPGVRIERIVSTGQASPPGFWYDQASDEWVMVLAGAARLLIEGEAERAMAAGDFVFLPAHRRHRVTWTDPERATVWLAVHIGESRGG